MLNLRSSHMTEWLKWPRPTSGPAMNINSINKLTQHLYLVTKTPSSKLMLWESLFKKLDHVANVGGAIHKDSALLTVRHATAVGRKVTGHRCVGPGGVLLDVHHHHTLPTDREGHQAASHSSSKEEEEARAVASSSRHPQQTQERRHPSQEDTLAQTGNFGGGNHK